MRMSARALLIVAAVAMAAAAGCAAGNMRPKLYLRLPDECNTPDGMTLDDKNNIILACPNFNEDKYPAVLMKIDPKGNLTKFFDMPLHPETKKAGPMGLDFGPDGNLYVADNQYFSSKDYKSRLIRVSIKDGKPSGADVAVEGLKLANAVIWRGNYVYVSDTFLDVPGKPGMSGIWRFSIEELKQGTVKVKPGLDDPHLIATFQTAPNHRGDFAGADGLTFDAKGNLYTGNFGDGAFSRIEFDADGKVVSNAVLIKCPQMPCVDGIFYDCKTDRILVADSERNAIHAVTPDGKLETLWVNDDTDGSDGLLDQPCEVLIRGNQLIIVNFDMSFPGLKNSKYDKWHTLCVITLDR
jgi:sugar lactone lactonase YvrE